MDYFQRAVKHNPSLPQGYFNLANALYALGEVDPSRAAIKKAIILYEQAGQLDKAKEIKEKLEALEP